MNENLPLYAFANTYSTLDVSLNDLRLQISFFEYALGAAEDIANKIKQTTDEYINTILPPLTKALFKYVREGKYTFCTPGHMGGTAFQKSPVGSLFYDFFGPNTMKSDIPFQYLNWVLCWITVVHTKKQNSISLASLTQTAATW